jgi:hypothetical protein
MGLHLLFLWWRHVHVIIFGQCNDLYHVTALRISGNQGAKFFTILTVSPNQHIFEGIHP